MQTPLGGHSPQISQSSQTELVFDRYTAQKTALDARLGSLTQALVEAQRLNKALKVGRVPNLVVDILQRFQEASLIEHFTVVGTHAMYAYETAAGVRIMPSALATQDVDLLWDARKRVKFIAEMTSQDTSVIQVLQRADNTFVRMENQNETAINAKGFQVDFLRRQPEHGDLRFSQVVVAANGHMAMMKTISPEAFVDFKRWLANKASEREPIKRRRDQLQADIVQSLIDEGLLVTAG